MDINQCRIAVIGLGYVGLPLAVEFGRFYPTLGFDINEKRIDQLGSGTDVSYEVGDEAIARSSKLKLSANPDDLALCNVYIVAVPTPAEDSRPNLNPLIFACELLGKVLKKDDVIIFESTVYPGATEEKCVPCIEEVSGLKFNLDFFVGYSPERINPGDKKRGLTQVVKLVSGSTVETEQFVRELYSSIIKAGVHVVSSIKIAEAAKLIENVQRDVNIALINEFSMIFNRLGIDTEEVLTAAETKWNFLSFRPGLVGGHCIGVDSYYLAYKAEEIGHHAVMTLSGRRINEGMAEHIVVELIKKMVQRCFPIHGARVLLLGCTFKENCTDLRNTKIVDIARKLIDYNVQVDIYDPFANKDDVLDMYDLNTILSPALAAYDAVVLAVAHDEFRSFDEEIIRSWGKAQCLIYDLKYILPKASSDLRL
ncbi:nucleotide sugar dehydrogenase [Pseudomonas sp. P8_241]|jgi:UDP-N-acetyl-D-galactosamine dehydrogenase|uniref:nucleotide sugar dehydrogenase n=1 Tax=Pseudomonas sp. P8_241 TaxID=3043445 RepID=UPI002A35EB70|nr:nucleotide sugar dehydrogenase [Pseudomonas sp. P8_241]WPN49456.1 nucleotide sugar dehydrogenase [Pseudomonas sp. P8_241]